MNYLKFWGDDNHDDDTLQLSLVEKLWMAESNDGIEKVVDFNHFLGEDCFLKRKMNVDSAEILGEGHTLYPKKSTTSMMMTTGREMTTANRTKVMSILQWKMQLKSYPEVSGWTNPYLSDLTWVRLCQAKPCMLVWPAMVLAALSSMDGTVSFLSLGLESGYNSIFRRNITLKNLIRTYVPDGDGWAISHHGRGSKSSSPTLPKFNLMMGIGLQYHYKGCYLFSDWFVTGP